MNLLLHTIALEPARWTPQRVSRSLIELLPHIAATEFRQLEIYEPHLTDETTSSRIKDELSRLELTPVILSSYLNPDPVKTTDAEFEAKLQELVERMAFYQFRKLRIFPGPHAEFSDRDGIEVFSDRVARLAESLPQVQVLLETHDGSLADDPKLLTQIVDQLALPNVGLLFQPTFFADPAGTLEQLKVQKHLIRHLHLQNRNPDLSFATLKDGVVPWPTILHELGDKIDATIEFVPIGICPLDQFDLGATLSQAGEEADYIRAI